MLRRLWSYRGVAIYGAASGAVTLSLAYSLVQQQQQQQQQQQRLNAGAEKVGMLFIVHRRRIDGLPLSFA